MQTSFEDYWQTHLERYRAQARQEWELLAQGPFQGKLVIAVHDDCKLSIGESVEVWGLSQELVARKLVAILESSHLLGTPTPEDAQEWHTFRLGAQRRLLSGDHDFSVGAIVCVDVAIVRRG